MATMDAMALLAMVPLCLLPRVTGMRPFLVGLPLLGLAATTVLLAARGDGVIFAVHDYHHDDPGHEHRLGLHVYVSLFTLSLIEIVAPIIPLALVPTAAGDVLGAAYGTIEGMLSGAQVAIAILLGVVRHGWGFTGALWLTTGGFFAAFVTSLPLMARAVKERRAADGGETT